MGRICQVFVLIYRQSVQPTALYQVASIGDKLRNTKNQIDGNVLGRNGNAYSLDMCISKINSISNSVGAIVSSAANAANAYQSNENRIKAMGEAMANEVVGKCNAKICSKYETYFEPISDSYVDERVNREAKAKVIKGIVTGACIIGSAALIIASGGTATPLVVGLISATSCAIMATTNNLADQYTEKGNLIDNWNKIDWESAQKDTLIGAVSGFATGYIGQVWLRMQLLC